MLHGNPRSVDEFLELMNLMDKVNYSYLAVDLFG